MTKNNYFAKKKTHCDIRLYIHLLVWVGTKMAGASPGLVEMKDFFFDVH